MLKKDRFLRSGTIKQQYEDVASFRFSLTSCWTHTCETLGATTRNLSKDTVEVECTTQPRKLLSRNLAQRLNQMF